MTDILQIQSLNKSFGGIKATDDLNLSVQTGELHAIIGPNGAGKTTLISQLSGGQKPDTGKILFKGRNIAGQPAHKRASLGITRSFQITSLIMEMSVLDNIALAVQAGDGHSFRFLRPARSISHLRDRALELLKQVDLAEKADHQTVALSHGEHRRMELAIALASEADLMLLDEPMAGLGTHESHQMVELLRGIKGRHTILLIEHDMDAVFALADRISVLVYGHIIATGTPAEIRDNEAVQHAYLGEE
ncbi:MAG: ABC transporter ATP-binding protein [Heliomarina sp.]|uniref:ABC transporter ATP-binding protein n=1 Tax=Heliomarina sp. TaxID=2917556 RepID=UPI004058E711